jgi:hypothetical protein
MTIPARRRFLERVATRDERWPLDQDDLEMSYSYRCVAVPPDDDPGWFVLDPDYSDRTTLWVRWHEVEGTA